MSADQFDALGIEGVDSEQQAALLADALSMAGKASTVDEVQALADAAGSVMDAAAGAADLPTLDELTLLGIVGVTADNLAEVQAAIAATADDGSAVDSVVELQVVSVVVLDPVAISIDAVAEDNIIDSSEDDGPVMFTGALSTANNVASVSVSINGVDYTATIDGVRWAVGISSSVVQSWPAGALAFTASALDRDDSALAVATGEVTYAPQPVVSIDAVAGDDVITLSEDDQDITISGTTINVEDGQTVSVTFNGNTYTATVNGGVWQAVLPAADAQALPPGDNTLTANVSNLSGTPAAEASKTVRYDTEQPTISISIDPIAGDGVINAMEDDGNVSVSGSTENIEAGQSVTVIIGAHSYSALVNASGNWSVSVPAAHVQALAEGSVVIYADVSNQAGVQAEQATLEIVHDTTAAISISPVAMDNSIGIAEASANVEISGLVVGIEDGWQVTLTLTNSAGENVTPVGGLSATIVDGVWRVELTAAQVSALPAGDINVEASAQDAAGNMASSTSVVCVQGAGLVIALSGDALLDGVLTAGETMEVTFTFDTAPTTFNVDYVKVESGALSNFSAPTTVGDKTVYTATFTPTDTIDASNALQVVLDETGQPRPVMLADFGSQANVRYDEASFTLSSEGDHHRWGWSGAFSETFLSGDGSVTFIAGLPGTSAHRYMVGLSATDDDLRHVTIDYALYVNSDGQLGVFENGIDRGSLGVVEDGDVLSITRVGDRIFYYNLSQDSNPIYASRILSTGNLHLDVGFREAGNGAEIRNVMFSTNTTPEASQSDFAPFLAVSDNYSVATVDPSVTVDLIAGDDVISTGEIRSDIEISGSTVGVAVGQMVTVVIAEKAGGGATYSYQAAVQDDGGWTVTLPGAVVETLTAAEHAVTVSATDINGQAVTATRDLTVQGLGLTITLSDSELTANETAVVTFTFDTAPTTFDINYVTAENGALDNFSGPTMAEGKTVYTATFTPNVATDDSNVIQVVLDGSGQPLENTSAQSGVTISSDNYRVLTQQPTITIDAIAGDNSLTATETQSDIEITGSTQSVEAGRIVTVVITDAAGNKTYQGVVQADGSWQVTLPSATAQALDADTDHAVTASVSDANGQMAEAIQTLQVGGVGLIIELSDTELTVGETAQVTFTFDDDKAPTAFDADYVIVENGALSNFQPAADGVATVFTATFTPNSVVDADNAIRVVLDENGQPRPADFVNFGSQTNVNYDQDSFTLSAEGNFGGQGHSGAFSEDFISGDGSLTFVIVSVPETPKQRYLVGLSAVDEDLRFSTVDYGWLVNHNGLMVLENGQGRSELLAFDEGDVLSIVRDGNVIRYYNLSKDSNTPVHQTLINSIENLHVDVSFRNEGVGAEFRNVVLSDDVTTPTASQSGFTPFLAVSDNYSLATLAPMITLDAIGDGNVVTIAAISNDIEITGSTEGIEAGQLVTVTITDAGVEKGVYQGFVGVDGGWQVILPGAEIQALDVGADYTVTVSADNASGQAAEVTQNLRVEDVGLTIELSSNALMAGDTATVTFTFDTAPTVFNADYVKVESGVLSGFSAPSTVAGKTVYTATFTPDNTTDIDNAIQVMVDQQGQPRLMNLTGFVNQVNASYDESSFTLFADGSQSSWNQSGAFSESSFSGDGSVTFIAGKPATNDQRYMVGLSVADEDVRYGSIDYALFIEDSKISVFENGVSIDVEGTIAEGDVLGITRVNGTVRYYNLTQDANNPIYVSTLNSTGDLYVDVSFREAGEGAEIRNVVISDNASPTADQSDYTAYVAKSDNYRVSTQESSISIDAIAGDDVLDSLEAGALMISGNVTGVADGQVITLEVAGQSYAGRIDDGAWAVRIPSADAIALPDGALTLTASVKDLDGNDINSSRDFEYDSASVLTVLIDKTALAAGEEATVTFIFKQAVDGFDASDINAPNGTLENLETQDNGVTWTATFKPNSDAMGAANFISVGSDWTYRATGESPSDLPAVELAVFDNVDVTAEGGVRFDGLHQRVVSEQSLGADGVVSALVTETDTSRMLGLVTSNDDDRGAARYAIRLNADSTLDIVENGAVKAVFDSNRFYRDGDAVSLERYNDTVVYRHNDEVIYVSEMSSGGPLYVDLTFATEGAVLKDVQIDRFTGSSSSSYQVNTAAPSVSIDAVSVDDAIRLGEAFVISGATTNVEDGQMVSVALGGQTYQAAVKAGAWSVTAPLADAQALSTGTVQITADVSNAVGVAAQARRDVAYDATPAVTLSLDDMVVTIGETATLTVTFDQAVTGFSLESLTATNGSLSDLQTDDGGKTWEATYTPYQGVDAADNLITLNQANAPYYLSDGQQVPVASVVIDDVTGEVVQRDHVDSGTFTVSTSTPLVSVDVVGGDNIVGPDESANGFVISGMAYGAAAGQVLSLILNGKVYQSALDGDGAWQVVVPKADADALPQGDNSYTATVNNLASIAGSVGGRFTYDSTPPLAITLDNMALAAGQSAEVTFTFRAAVQDFDLSDVTVSNGTLDNFSGPTTVGDKTVYTATFMPTADTTSTCNLIEVGDRWSFVDDGVAPASTVAHATFEATDGLIVEANNLSRGIDQENSWDTYAASNEIITGSGSVSATVAENDTDRVIGLSAKDGTDNASGVDFAIYLDDSGRLFVSESGRLVAGVRESYNSGDVVKVERLGAKICYSLNGELIYTSEQVSSGDLYADAALFTAGATLNNIVIDDGNTAVSDAYLVLTGAPAITLNAVAGDDVISAVEASRDLLVTGTVTHIADGEQVALMFDGQRYTAEVAQGEFAVAISAAELQALGAGAMDVTASYTNAAGGQASAVRSVSGDGMATPLTITVSNSSIGVGEIAIVTFTFAEAVTDFGLDDIQVGSGALSGLSSNDGGVTWTAQLTPEPGSDAMHNAIVVNNAWRYVSGNPTPATGEVFDVIFSPEGVGRTAVINGNSVTKVARQDGWAANAIGTSTVNDYSVDSGAFSVQAINGNGYVSTRLGDDGGVKAIGLSYANANNSFISMDYGVVLAADGSLSFYQAGQLQVSAPVTAGSGDVLRIQVNDGVVSVNLNSAVVYTYEQAANAAPLHADIALNTVGAAFYDVMMSDEAVAVSNNYAVDTALTLQDASVSGNVITLAYSQMLSALSVPSVDSFGVKVDGSGRQVTDVAIENGQLQVTFGGNAITDNQQVEYSYTATGANKVQDLYGVLADNVGHVIFGSDNLQTLEDTDGNDTVVGTSGDDVIAINGGSDYLIGLQGSDTFDFNHLLANGEGGVNTIADFQTDPGGDVIDLSDVLDGFESGVSDLADFVRAETVNDADDRVAIKIDTDGASNGVPGVFFIANMTIVLDNVHASDVNMSTFIADLNDDNNIVLG